MRLDLKPAEMEGNGESSKGKEVDEEEEDRYKLTSSEEIEPSSSTSGISPWMFEFDTKLLGDNQDSIVSNLVSPVDCQNESSVLEEDAASKVSIYKTPKNRLSIVQQLEATGEELPSDSEEERSAVEAESTLSKPRPTPLPLLNWADNKEVWQNIVYKEEARLKCRNAHLFDTRNTAYLPRMRAILLDWIMEVCEVYQLRRNTYHLAVDYIDRYLTIRPNVPKTQLQLLGVSCLFVAAKLEEIYPPKLSEFSYVCDGACSNEEILACEVLLLNTLEWDINPMTPTGWLNLYMQIHHNNDNRLNYTSFNYPQYSSYSFIRASHLIDLFTLDPGYLRFSYSIIAAAAMAFVFGKRAALRASSLPWKQMSACMSYMSVFERTVQNAMDPRLLSIAPTIGDERLHGTLRWLKKRIPNLVSDENHSIQTHLVTLECFERAILRRLDSYGFQVVKTFQSKKKPTAQTDDANEDDVSDTPNPTAVLYELSPLQSILTDIDSINSPSPLLDPTSPSYESGKVNIFTIRRKVTVTFDDILASICNSNSIVVERNCVRLGPDD